jgi:hypothetical protein
VIRKYVTQLTLTASVVNDPDSTCGPAFRNIIAPSVKASGLPAFETALISDLLPEIVREKILLSPSPPKAEPPSEEKQKDA